MAFIDSTYFIGELNIPNSNNQAIQERLDWFIEKYEPEFLKALLGLSLHKAFMAGLTEDPVEQRWSDLLYGAEFTYCGELQEWMGLISQPLDLLNALDASNTITIVVNRGQQNDPVSGSNTVQLPPSLVGKDFIIERRAFGRLREDEYTVVGSTLTLLGGQIFNDLDTYFYKSVTLALNTSTGSVKRSLIANYIYYEWMKDQVTQTVGLGEVATNAENSTIVSPANKMIRANNEMIDWAISMFNFLSVNRSTYPELGMHDLYCFRRQFGYTNQFGI